MGPWRGEETRRQSQMEKVRELAFEPRPARRQNLTSSVCAGEDLHFSPHRKFEVTVQFWGQKKKDARECKRKVA